MSTAGERELWVAAFSKTTATKRTKEQGKVMLQRGIKSSQSPGCSLGDSGVSRKLSFPLASFGLNPARARLMSLAGSLKVGWRDQNRV